MADPTATSADGIQSPVATRDAPSSHGFFDPSAIPTAAARQVQQVVILGGTFFSTVVALLASAFGVVTALAWSRAIFDWLPTVPLLDFYDPLVREFADAGVTTFVAMVVVLFLGVAPEGEGVDVLEDVGRAGGLVVERYDLQLAPLAEVTPGGQVRGQPGDRRAVARRRR